MSEIVGDYGQSLNPGYRPGHEHVWQLEEEGYTRIWRVEIGVGGEIVAHDGRFSEEGDAGLYLHCYGCGTTKDLSEDEQDRIEYR